MDIYVARQPIFDSSMKLYGYELLYRKSSNNFYEGTDDNQSTAALINNSFLVIGFNELIDNTRGFINFPEALLLDETPLLLPKDRIVIELLERVKLSEPVLTACRKLKSAGYTIALDDFVLKRDMQDYTPLLELADIVKIEYPKVPLEEQRRLINKYMHKVSFLAERIETVEEFKTAVELGYRLFQGYFFCRPIMVRSKEIFSPDMNLLRILKELTGDEPDFRIITDIIEKDLGLSYKLLQMANSVYYGTLHTIKSIQQALIHLGTQEMIRWIHLMLLKGMQTRENAELIKASVIRGRMLSLMAIELKHEHCVSEGFILGIFSSIDKLLNRDMSDILTRLPLTTEVKASLLGADTEMRRCLNTIIAFENMRWDELDAALAELQITRVCFMELYLDALRWQQAIA